MDKVFQYIDQHRDRFINELIEFCRFPSVSAQQARNADTQACARWVVDQLKGLGLEADLIETSGQPIIRARTKTRAAKRVICYGHYDVQPEDPRDLWKTDPFTPVIRDGYLIARGSTDDKGQLWAHVKAVEAMIKTRGELPAEVVFLIEGEEECGGTGLAKYVAQHAQDLKTNLTAVLISDGSMWNETTPAITFGLRGIAAVEVVIHGPNRDLHSGTFGGAVANPALVLAQLLAKCYGPDGRVLVDGFYEGIRELTPAERQRLTALRHDETALAKSLNVAHLCGEQGFTAVERMWARPTLEINGIYGGYQGQGGKTIIPSKAGVKLTTRLVPDQNPDVIIHRVIDFLKANCPDTVRLEVIRTEAAGRPLYFDPDQPALRLAASALTKGFGNECAFIREGGSIPVAEALSTHLQAPVLLMGLGLTTDGAHSPNECFKLDHLIKGAKSIATLIDSLSR